MLLVKNEFIWKDPWHSDWLKENKNKLQNNMFSMTLFLLKRKMTRKYM